MQLVLHACAQNGALANATRAVDKREAFSSQVVDEDLPHPLAPEEERRVVFRIRSQSRVGCGRKRLRAHQTPLTLSRFSISSTKSCKPSPRTLTFRFFQYCSSSAGPSSMAQEAD